MRQAHRNALTLVAFLAIPKGTVGRLTLLSHSNENLITLADKEHSDSAEFRKFRRALFHGSVRYILQTLRPGMEEYEVIRYGDGFYRRTLYGIGPYIADYPEQVLIACIVQGWCARQVLEIP